MSAENPQPGQLSEGGEQANPVYVLELGADVAGIITIRDDGDQWIVFSNLALHQISPYEAGEMLIQYGRAMQENRITPGAPPTDI